MIIRKYKQRSIGIARSVNVRNDFQIPIHFDLLYLKLSNNIDVDHNGILPVVKNQHGSSLSYLSIRKLVRQQMIKTHYHRDLETSMSSSFSLSTATELGQVYTKRDLQQTRHTKPPAAGHATRTGQGTAATSELTERPGWESLTAPAWSAAAAARDEHCSSATTT